jgi:hypothetical protein
MMTDMTDKELFTEEKLLNSVKKLLSGRVNELLRETEYPIPPIEFGSYRGGSVVVPAISLSTCERTEKERIVRLDAYTLTVAFAVPEWPSDQRSVGERNCYAYAATVASALRDNPTLGGVVGRAELTRKKYVPPKQSGTGGEEVSPLTSPDIWKLSSLYTYSKFRRSATSRLLSTSAPVSSSMM